MKSQIIALIFLTFLPLYGYAGYLVVGPIEAKDCYNFGIKVCSTKTVTEVRVDGKRYEVSNFYENVSKFIAHKNMCYINTKSTDLGFLSLGINAFSQPDFWGYDKDGKYVKVDADYIYFKCIKK